jgi:hypothetical protein
MTGTANSHARLGAPSQLRGADKLTHVELTWIEKRVENWIRFGAVARDEIIDRRRRTVSFVPGSVFAFIRWASNDFGTVRSHIAILRAVGSEEAYQTLPFVRPGAEILLAIEGWPKVEQVLRHIDAVEAVGINPCAVSPDHWRHVANRMTVNLAPRAYTPERHLAWLKRREIEG